LRINNHQIMPVKSSKLVKIQVDGKEIEAYEGEPILAALWASEILVCRETEKLKEKRGGFCGIGRCGDCRMIVNGHRDVYTCSTPVENGMIIKTQKET